MPITSWHLRLLATAAAASLTCAASMSAQVGGELHTFHYLHGCPVGAPSIDDIVVREIYTLASNDLTKMADWVAYRVTPATIGKSGERDWQPDPWLDSTETLEEADYVGAPAGLGIDRGHQTPLTAFSGTLFAAGRVVKAGGQRAGVPGLAGFAGLGRGEQPADHAAENDRGRVADPAGRSRQLALFHPADGCASAGRRASR